MAIKKWIISGVIAAVLIFTAFYQSAAARYGRQIAEIQRTYAEAAADAEAQYREKERHYAQKLSEAVDKLAAVGADRDGLRTDLERVRSDNAALKRALSAGVGASCSAERRALARCSDLLERGADLLIRGAGMAERNVAERDALSSLHK